MSLTTVNKAIATVNSVAKKSVKVFGNVLPIATIGANVMQAKADYPDNFPMFVNRLIRNYTGFSMETGEWNAVPAAKGLGSLLVSLGARKLIHMLA